MIKSILFDMGNVLIRFDREFFIDRLGVAPEDRPLLMREVFLSVEWVQMDRGSIAEPEALARLEQFLLALPVRSPLSGAIPLLNPPRQRMTIRQAALSPAELLPLDCCRGRVLAAANVSCPPAIPVVVCGEVIDEAAIACLTYYGIDSCRVLI